MVSEGRGLCGPAGVGGGRLGGGVPRAEGCWAGPSPRMAAGAERGAGGAGARDRHQNPRPAGSCHRPCLLAATLALLSPWGPPPVSGGPLARGLSRRGGAVVPAAWSPRPSPPPSREKCRGNAGASCGRRSYGFSTEREKCRGNAGQMPGKMPGKMPGLPLPPGAPPEKRPLVACGKNAGQNAGKMPGKCRGNAGVGVDPWTGCSGGALLPVAPSTSACGYAAKFSACLLCAAQPFRFVTPCTDGCIRRVQQRPRPSVLWRDVTPCRTVDVCLRIRSQVQRLPALRCTTIPFCRPVYRRLHPSCAAEAAPVGPLEGRYSLSQRRHLPADTQPSSAGACNALHNHSVLSPRLPTAASVVRSRDRTVGPLEGGLTPCLPLSHSPSLPLSRALPLSLALPLSFSPSLPLSLSPSLPLSLSPHEAILTPGIVISFPLPHAKLIPQYDVVFFRGAFPRTHACC